MDVFKVTVMTRKKCIDIIGLETLADPPTRYRRIGRGRILSNAWLAQFTVQKITICWEYLAGLATIPEALIWY